MGVRRPKARLRHVVQGKETRRCEIILSNIALEKTHKAAARWLLSLSPTLLEESLQRPVEQQLTDGRLGHVAPPADEKDLDDEIPF